MEKGNGTTLTGEKKNKFSMMVKLTQVIMGVLNDGLLQGKHRDSDPA